MQNILATEGVRIGYNTLENPKKGHLQVKTLSKGLADVYKGNLSY